MKKIIRETVKNIKYVIHGNNEDGFTPMEAQYIYNILETFAEQVKEKK